MVLRFPGALESPLDDEDSENDSEDEEATDAVDRVLRKYDKAKVLMENADDNFDSREEVRLKQKMDEWKRTYYWVRYLYRFLGVPSDNSFRINSRYRTMTPARRPH